MKEPMTVAPTTRHSFAAALTVVAASTFVGMLAYAGPLGNAATISRALGATPADDAWMLAAMSAGLAVALLAAGVIGDRIGRRRVFLLGTAIFIVANLGSALAFDPAQFIIARAACGVGAAGAIATSLGLATAGGEPRHRTLTATWWSASLGGGIALGPIITGLLDLAGLWRVFFVMLAVAGLVVLLGAVRWVAPQETRAATDPGSSARVTGQFDGLGFSLLLALLATLIAAIVQARAADASVAVLTGAAVVLLIGLVVSQRFGSRRVIDPALLTHPPFLATTLASFGTGFGVIAAMSFVSTFLVHSLGVTTLVTGALLSAWSATSAVAVLVLARWTARMPGPTQLVVGLTVVALGLAGLAIVGLVGGHVSVWAFLPGMTIAGIGTGVLNSGLARQAVATVPAEAAATGTAASNTARYFGAALGITIASVIAGGNAPVGGFDLVAWGAAAVSILVAAAVARLSSQGRGRSAQ